MRRPISFGVFANDDAMVMIRIFSVRFNVTETSASNICEKPFFVLNFGTSGTFNSVWSAIWISSSVCYNFCPFFIIFHSSQRQSLLLPAEWPCIFRAYHLFTFRSRLLSVWFIVDAVKIPHKKPKRTFFQPFDYSFGCMVAAIAFACRLLYKCIDFITCSMEIQIEKKNNRLQIAVGTKNYRNRLKPRTCKPTINVVDLNNYAILFFYWLFVADSNWAAFKYDYHKSLHWQRLVTFTSFPSWIIHFSLVPQIIVERKLFTADDNCADNFDQRWTTQHYPKSIGAKGTTLLWI